MTEEASALIALNKQNEAILKEQKQIVEKIKVLLQQQKNILKENKVILKQQRDLCQRLQNHPDTKQKQKQQTPKTKGKRKLWTEEEHQALAKGVDQHGTESWDFVKSSCEELSARSTDALRRKWYALRTTSSSKRIKVVKENITNLDNMPDDIFFRVAQFLCPNSLCGVAKLCREVGAVSKSFREKCHKFMKVVPMEIDMAEINTQNRKKHLFPALEWLKGRTAKLRSFSVHCSGKDFGIITGFLHDCNASEMQMLSIFYQESSILNDYWWLCKRNDNAVFIDVDSISIPRTYRDMAFECGVNPDLICDLSALSKAILQHAPKVKCLRFHSSEKNFVCELLNELHYLEELEIGWNRSGRDESNNTTIENVIQRMPKLRKLKIVGIHSVKSDLLKIISETLDEVDVVSASKHFWCQKVVCPSLRLFRCRGGRYGNGIRPRLPRGIGFNHVNLDIYGIKRSGDFPCEEVAVPDSCVFDFLDGY